MRTLANNNSRTPGLQRLGKNNFLEQSSAPIAEHKKKGASRRGIASEFSRPLALSPTTGHPRHAATLACGGTENCDATIPFFSLRSEPKRTIIYCAPASGGVLCNFKSQITMKNIFKSGLISTLVAILVLGFIFISCEKEQIIKKKTSDYTIIDFKSDMKHIGEIHNECMDFILSRHKNQNNYSPENIIANTKHYGENFIKQNFESDDIPDIVHSYTGNYIRDEENNNELWFKKDEGKLSDLQKNVLSSINNIIDSYDNLEDILYKLDCLEASIMKEGNSEEQYIAIVASEIAMASLYYWHNNCDNWQSLAETTEKEKWFNWKSVGKEDVKGAVAGACGVGAAAAVAGPPGWAAGTAAVAGASIGSSAAEAAGQIWDRVFGK
jgi:hypothetical protein